MTSKKTNNNNEVPKNQDNLLNGKLVIVTASPGTRDHIYLGFAERFGDLLLLTNAKNIMHYRDDGIPGVAGDPAKADRTKDVMGPNGEMVIPISSIASIIFADMEKWETHLRKTSNG